MALQIRNVVVKQLPQTLNDEQVWAFLESFKLSLSADRPRVVLNCANLSTFDKSSLHLLLCCLEEAMKRNGDVQLSSLSEPARAALEASGIGKLFKSFDSDSDAIKSFQRLPFLTVPEKQASIAPLAVDEGAQVSLDATENAA